MRNAVPDVPPSHRSAATVCHLLVLCGFVLPFGGLVGPLLLWLAKRREMPFLEDQGREVLNFSVSFFLWNLLAVLLCGGIAVGGGFFLPEERLLWLVPLLVFALWILFSWSFCLVMPVLGAAAAWEGRRFRYPLTLAFLRP